MLLNDEFEGGDLQIECGSPAKEDRAQSIPLQKGDIVFFPSYVWHRVFKRPCVDGIARIAGISLLLFHNCTSTRKQVGSKSQRKPSKVN